MVGRNESSFSYEDDEKKLLLIKINIIFATFKNK